MHFKKNENNIDKQLIQNHRIKINQKNTTEKNKNTQ